MRIPSGISGFDALIDGGLPANRLYVLSGPPGSGKTTFASQFAAAGVRAGESCLYLSLHETESELITDLSRYSFGFEQIAASSGFHFRNLLDDRTDLQLRPTGDTRDSVDRIPRRIQDFVEKHDIARVVLDSTMLLAYYGASDAMLRVVTGLKRTAATVVLIAEMTDPTAYADEHYLAHGVVFLHNFLNDGGMERGIQIVKMRGCDIDTEIHQLEFTRDGMQIDPARSVTTPVDPPT